MQWEGHSSASQTVSELSAIGAPTRPLWVLLGIAYTLLVTAFGWGVWQSARRNRPLRVVGGLMVAYGVIGLASPLAPMHLSRARGPRAPLQRSSRGRVSWSEQLPEARKNPRGGGNFRVPQIADSPIVETRGRHLFRLAGYTTCSVVYLLALTFDYRERTHASDYSLKPGLPKDSPDRLARIRRLFLKLGRAERGIRALGGSCAVPVRRKLDVPSPRS
jgi:hypothetical protein